MAGLAQEGTERKPDIYNPWEAMLVREGEGYYNEKVSWLVNYAYKNDPDTKAKLSNADIKPGQIKAPKDVEDIPITYKEQPGILKRAAPIFNGYIIIPPKEAGWIFVSPGSIYWVALDFNLIAKALYADGFKEKGYTIVVTMTYYLLVVAGVLFNDELISELGATVISIGTGNTDLQAGIMRNARVTVYYGAPNFLYSIIKRAR